MKKVAQGKERRRERQLDAAEREVDAADLRRMSVQGTLDLRMQEIKHAQGLQLLELRDSVQYWTDQLRLSEERLTKAQERLNQLKAGSF